MKKKIISVTFLALLGTSITSQAALTDLGNGLIYDTDLNITWLADGNYAKTSGYHSTGAMNWGDATTWATSLALQGHSDWRLPTFDEMNHLFYGELGGSDSLSISYSHNMSYNLFSNIQSGYYWTEKESGPGFAPAFTFSNGRGFPIDEKIGLNAMAVSPGDIAAVVPEPEAYAMMLAGLGLLGWRMRQRSN